MKKILVAMLGVLMCAGTCFGGEEKFPYDVPEVEYLSPGITESFYYVCVDGYVFVLRTRGGLAQLIEKDEDGLPTPVKCRMEGKDK